MRELFEQVLDLQTQHSAENTPEMAARGNLIRSAIPEEIRRWPAAQPLAAAPFMGELKVQGRDGTTNKAFVPWIRVFSPELSRTAQRGWYVVYLFRQDGEGVALCICHGSTKLTDGSYKPRKDSEATSLMRWGRGLIGIQAAANGMRTGVDLGSAETLSRAYENTVAFSQSYARDAIPSDAVLASDLERAVALLGVLYRAQTLGAAPGSEPPELEELEQLTRLGSRAVARGQGFGLNAAERAAVEQHAMAMAMDRLTADGFVNIRDVHKTHSCDFIAKRDGTEYIIEVKGTTSSLGKVILTANEVALHKGRHPANVLVVVHNIELRGTHASGGTVHVLDPFVVDDCALAPLSYMCQLP